LAMKVLIITQWYPPEPALLLQELAQTLQVKRHDVTILTGFPNYPSGNLYPGYRLRLFLRETVAGVSVVRVPLYCGHDRSNLRRALNYISFALFSALLGPWLIPRQDVIFVYHPPLTIGIPAFVLSRWWRVPFIYQIQDMWPEALSAVGAINNPRILNWISRFAKWIYAKADAICVISPGARANLHKKGVPGEKIHVISNWVNIATYYPERPDSILAKRLGLAGRFNVIFAGNVGEAQGLETLLDAAELLGDVPEVQFVIVGDGVALPCLRQSAEERALGNICFLGRYAVEAMPPLYALADVLLIHLRDDHPLFRITIPHKTFAYMATGKPILAAVAGDVADVVTGAGAGIACPPQDSQVLALTIRQFYFMPEVERKAMGERGLAAVKAEFSKEKLVADIEDVLRTSLNNM
jgi:colanic acid biosynthesis glycosyl transferase WcaI